MQFLHFVIMKLNFIVNTVLLMILMSNSNRPGVRFGGGQNTCPGRDHRIVATAGIGLEKPLLGAGKPGPIK